MTLVQFRMNMGKLPVYCLMASVYAFTGHANAENSTSPADQHNQSSPSTNPSTEEYSYFSVLDQPQQYIASGVLGFSQSVDEFFSDEKAEYESSDSYIRLTADSVFTDGEGWGFKGSTRARLVLPNTQRKLRLVFESDPDQEREDPQQPLNNNPIDAAENKSYFAGIEGLLGEFERWRFRPGIGLRLNRQFNFFARFRASRNYEISENWQAYFGNTLYWFSSSGYRFDSRLDLDWQINSAQLFRASTSAQWQQPNDWWNLAQVFSLTDSIDKRQAMVYLAGIYGINEPNTHAENYRLQMRYRRLLHSDYLFMELIPQIEYPQDNDFMSVFSLTLRLEMVFQQ